MGYGGASGGGFGGISKYGKGNNADDGSFPKVSNGQALGGGSKIGSRKGIADIYSTGGGLGSKEGSRGKIGQGGLGGYGGGGFKNSLSKNFVFT